MLGRFGENSTAVQSVVDYLADRRCVGIYVHPITSAQVTDYAFSGNIPRDAGQLGETARLNMINSEKPLIQRQVLTKSHDCVLPLPIQDYLLKNPSIFNSDLRCIADGSGCSYVVKWLKVAGCPAFPGWGPKLRTDLSSQQSQKLYRKEKRKREKNLCYESLWGRFALLSRLLPTN